MESCSFLCHHVNKVLINLIRSTHTLFSKFKRFVVKLIRHLSPLIFNLIYIQHVSQGSEQSNSNEKTGTDPSQLFTINLKLVSHTYPSWSVYSTTELKCPLFIDDDDFQMTNRFESRRTTYWVLTGLTVNYWYLKRGHLPLPKLSRALFQSPLICVTWLPICDCEGPPPQSPT